MRRLKIRKKFALITMALAVVTVGSVLQAAPRLPRLFADNMVLQREKPVPVWGWAEAGEKVTVSFAGQEISDVTRKSGKWKVILKKMKASSEERDLKISSDKTGKPLILSNIVVGDVWICSGQSNMEWNMGGVANSKEEVAAARDIIDPRGSDLRPPPSSTPNASPQSSAFRPALTGNRARRGRITDPESCLESLFWGLSSRFFQHGDDVLYHFLFRHP